MTSSPTVDNHTAFTEVPVIDIGALVAGDPDPAARERVVAEIGAACRDVGFFYVTNHGIAPADSATMFAAAKAFFELPLADKMAIRLGGNTDQFRGFVPLGGEVTAGKTDWHECLDLQPKWGRDAASAATVRAPRDGHPLDDPEQWPTALPEFRTVMMRSWDQLWGLSARIAAGMALSLGLDEHFFAQYEGAELSDLRMVHYPPFSREAHPHAPDGVSIDQTELGFGAHVDYGFLAVLQQDGVGGLEVRNAEGEWIAAPHIPGTFLVNIGLMMQRWTNDRYQATWHRVQIPGTSDRYSIPFFFEPRFDAVVEPLPQCVDADNPPRYEPCEFGPYVVDLFAKAYD
ncbi:isopenicillin N synthase family dioxygenase [Actinokineospora terrae]|uniref:Isopenicillin N synthase n=1 Tax=Actinokineospora terrae TaxID=155974 RepID=A0A1H9P002_9PSEU|nr:2-oxoglutarate and iron-dependent oxygenase domain-containing protein [Actinokineospora terrae]SER40913.1 Isopenicillin N synthase [Actinokineospora terrae]